jgi:hypothetical protein
MASRLDPLEQPLVATGKPVEPRLRRPLVRIRCRSGDGIGCSGDGIGCSRATAGRAGDGAGQIRGDRGLRSDRRDCRGDRSDRIEKLGARHRGAANHPAQREHDEAQSSYGRRPPPTSPTPLWSGETRTRRGFGPSGIRRDFSSSNMWRTRPARRRVLRLRRPAGIFTLPRTSSRRSNEPLGVRKVGGQRGRVGLGNDDCARQWQALAPQSASHRNSAAGSRGARDAFYRILTRAR